MSVPVKTIRCGSIQASVWSNSAEYKNTLVEKLTVKIQKSYKKDNEWKNTQVFTIEDLPKVSIVAMEVYKYIRLKQPEYNKEYIE
jgi:hypothetical protein